MFRKIIATLVVLAVVCTGIYFAVQRNTVETSDAASTLQVRVVTSFYPLYEFTQHVAGANASITNLTPPGAEPHTYEPTPSALTRAQKADLFIYNDPAFEPWVRGVVTDRSQTQANVAVNQQLVLQPSEVYSAVKDPHTWLDPVYAQRIVSLIADELSQIDPAHQTTYQQRAREYNRSLVSLDQAYQKGLTNCALDTIVTSHNAFGYLAHRYHFKVIPIAGLSTDDEPSAAKLANISQTVRAQNLHYIFFERLVSPRLADTIATETGAQTLVFDPIEGLSNDSQKNGQNYLGIQYENLKQLRTALACR